MRHLGAAAEQVLGQQREGQVRLDEARPGQVGEGAVRGHRHGQHLLLQLGLAGVLLQELPLRVLVDEAVEPRRSVQASGLLRAP